MTAEISLSQRVRHLGDDCWNPTNEALLHEAADRLEGAEAALKKYGWHDMGEDMCPAILTGEDKGVCNCGFFDALEGRYENQHSEDRGTA